MIARGSGVDVELKDDHVIINRYGALTTFNTGVFWRKTNQH